MIARADAAAAAGAGPEAVDLTEHLQPPVFVPETLSGMELLEHFRARARRLVFVVDEYGEVQGVITVRDVLEAITGEFVGAEPDEDAWAVQRADGSWLIDGLIPIPELKDRLDLKELPEEDRGRYNTLAGMVMLLLGRLPRHRPTASSGTAGASRWSTSTASASTRCSPARSRRSPVAHEAAGI